MSLYEAVLATFRKVGVLKDREFSTKHSESGWSWALSAASWACRNPTLRPGVHLALVEFFAETFGPPAAAYFEKKAGVIDTPEQP